MAEVDPLTRIRIDARRENCAISWGYLLERQPPCWVYPWQQPSVAGLLPGHFSSENWQAELPRVKNSWFFSDGVSLSPRKLALVPDNQESPGAKS